MYARIRMWEDKNRHSLSCGVYNNMFVCVFILLWKYVYIFIRMEIVPFETIGNAVHQVDA
jgi:hypothetical protein